MASFAALQKALDVANVEYAVIGAHAVNAWVEPRFTGDFDITVQADGDALDRLARALSSEGYKRDVVQGDGLASGPDFVRFTSADGEIDLEVQLAKTEFQDEVIRRAGETEGLSVATPEDLIVMKLIANRPKDRADLAGLMALDNVDWAYVERWAGEWDVLERLDRLRAGADG
jgi:hypothetical protein